MKKIVLLFCYTLFIIYPVLGFTLKYTDLNNARKLATALQHSSIGSDFMVSIDIRKVAEQQYYLEGVARSGKIYKLTIDYLQQLAKKEEIFLRHNNVLIFPFKSNSSFVLFNRKEFRQVALNAKTYLKSYTGDDPLAGQNIFHSIKSLDIVPYAHKNSRFGVNLFGDYYHYILEVHNGEKDSLTYYDAYKLLEDQRLLVATYPDIPAMDKVYSIIDMKFQKLKLAYGNTPQFSIILIFDQAILLTEEMVGIEIVEQEEYKDYLIYITVPNSTIKQEFFVDRQYEYLKNISLVNDSRYISRAVLKMQFNPLLTNLAPHITKIDERSIIITFFYRGGFDAVAHSEEKNIIFNPFLAEERKQQGVFAQSITEYRAEFEELIEEKDIVLLATGLQNLVARINQDSIQITSDEHLARIFELRHQIKNFGYNAITNFALRALSDNSINLGSIKMQEVLIIAEGFTGKRNEIENIRKLKVKF